MIDKGANPFVLSSHGNTQFEIHNLRRLSKLQPQKSVYFTTRPFEGEFKDKTSFPEPWFYENGVFDGKFSKFLGKGAAGTVLSGEWFGKKAAFKFVEVGTQKNHTYTKDALKTLAGKLTEMTSIQSTVGSKIVKFYGHYR